MDFSDSLRYLKKGKSIYRNGWNGKGMYVTLQSQSCEMTVPYLYITNVREHKLPWQPSQEDILANDWMVK